MLMRTVYSKRIAALAIVAAFLLSSLPLAALGQTKPGVDTTGMDRSVDPGDDFFLYANGGWYNKTEIPADRTSLGVFQGIAAEVARRNAGLITDAAKQNDARGEDGHRLLQRLHGRSPDRVARYQTDRAGTRTDRCDQEHRLVIECAWFRTPF